jgi:trimethylamine--corrinoid protein Co-methyltransferase
VILKLSKLSVLTDEELKMIDNASLEILGETGIAIKSRDVLSFLEDKGLDVDYDSMAVRFEPGLVRKAVSSVPKQFEIFNRDQSDSFKLGGGNPTRTAAGHNAVFIQDHGKKERRPCSKKEVGTFAKIANYLDDIDVVAPEAMPQDVNAKASILHAVDAVISNTVKPVLFSPENAAEVEALIEMIKAIMGSERIDKDPVGICQFSPSSPLFWNEGTIKGFIRIVEEGFPCTILPGPLAGATSPYTLSSNLVQRNCEVLSGVVIAHLINRKAPLLSYNGGGQFDMMSLTGVLGTPEVTLISIAGTQLAQHYGIPTHGCVPCSDSHCMDMQLGIENMLLTLAGMACGTDLLVNAGMYATGETASYEQLVMDNEIIRIARRMVRGFDVNKETMSVKSIKKAGPRGNFLTDITTLINLRSGEWSESEIFTRQKYESWIRKGGKTAMEKANDISDRIKKMDDFPIENDKRKLIDEIIADFEKRQV